MFDRLKQKIRNLIYEETRRAMERVMFEESFNIERQIQRLAMEESARYVIENIALYKVLPDKWALLWHCLELIPADGLVLEFGVYKGATIRHIAERLPGRRVYGFDSFEGLHEPWINHNEGAFKVDGLPAVPENVTLIKGLFQDTSAGFLADHPGDIAFLHIDSDLYSSCKYILDTYCSRIVPGTIIVFDEFYNYAGWTRGEAKAFREWCEAAGVEYEFVGYTARRGHGGPNEIASGQQLAVKIVARAGSRPQPAPADAAAST